MVLVFRLALVKILFFASTSCLGVTFDETVSYIYEKCVADLDSEGKEVNFEATKLTNDIRIKWTARGRSGKLLTGEGVLSDFNDIRVLTNNRVSLKCESNRKCLKYNNGYDYFSHFTMYCDYPERVRKAFRRLFHLNGDADDPFR